jgi:hypothetical protein
MGLRVKIGSWPKGANKIRHAKNQNYEVFSLNCAQKVLFSDKKLPRSLKLFKGRTFFPSG